MVEPGVVTETDGATYFRIIYHFPKQVLLTLSDWETGVMDECVQRALAADYMPVGSVFVTDPVDVEPDTGEIQVALEEGSRINVQEFMAGLGMSSRVSVDMCKVVAEVAISLSGGA